jgi:hypothetical protein
VPAAVFIKDDKAVPYSLPLWNENLIPILNDIWPLMAINIDTLCVPAMVKSHVLQPASGSAYPNPIPI